MSKKIIEAEIIEEPGGFKYKQSYQEYTSKSKDISYFVWIFSLLGLVFSVIPVFGFIYNLIALFINIIKQIPPVIPILALVISGFVTSVFLLIVWFFRIVF
jgi:hypothetical protein